MKFIWSELLWLLTLIPILVAVYIWLQRRRRKAVVRYAGLSLVKAAMGKNQSWRRHIPPALLLLAITAMLIAVARPTAIMTLPSTHRTVVLAMDVSGSMRARDVEPSRLVAAQAAARAFVDQVPASTRIAVVEFAATASVVQTPTKNRQEVFNAIDRFELQRGTAVGSGILISLKSLFPEMVFNLRRANPRVAGSADANKNSANATPSGAALTDGSAAIILLTDGQSTTGPDPVVSAEMAAERGIRIYTVGIGTPDGFIIGSEGWSMRVRLDEDALKSIASVTDGEYFFAGTAEELKQVYEALNTKLVFEKRETEITSFFSALAAALTILAALLSMLWINRAV